MRTFAVFYITTTLIHPPEIMADIICSFLIFLLCIIAAL